MAKKAAPAKAPSPEVPAPEVLSGTDSRGRNITITLLDSVEGINSFAVTVNGDKLHVKTALSAEEYLKAL